jgi:hypothetical protein
VGRDKEMKSKWILALVAVLLLVSVAGAGLALANQKPLEGRALWEAQGIDDYRFVLERVCFCLARGPVVIEVRDGKMVSIVDAATGEPVNEGWALAEIYGDVSTLDKLFDVIDGARGAEILRVSYDAELGYPTEIYIDESSLMIDEEMRYLVSGFELLD